MTQFLIIGSSHLHVGKKLLIPKWVDKVISRISTTVSLESNTLKAQ